MVQLTFLVLVALASTTLASPFMKHRKRVNERPSFNTKADHSFFRLPTTTIPEEYDIQLVVDPTQDNFTGETTIWIRAMEQTSSIILHAYELRFNSIVLKDGSGEELSISNTTSRDDRHFLNITLNDNKTLVENERYELVINYWTMFTPYIAGMYKTSYINESGTRRYMVATQFQATYARDAFPCYDEPSFKAIFNVHIYHPEEYEAISNMDVIPSTLPPMPDMNVTSFRTTPLMSTYLLAMVVSDLSYKSNTRDGSIIYPKEYRVYARQAAMPYVDYALDFGQRSISFMEAYTDVKDRMLKVDNVALPVPKQVAMENWGLITYVEDFLLYEKGVSTTLDEFLLNQIMSHENSHFWFGNEVSPAWWDYLWLNEGFATYFGNYVTDKLQNGWRVIEEFVVDSTQYVMIEDSRRYSHAMNNEVGSPDDVEGSFDGIAYLKAASVVRMIQNMVGEQLFQAALSSYIKSLPTGISTPDILYEEMEKVIGNSIQITDNGTFSDVFRSWADQPGYPVVNMTSITGSTTVVVTQERFYNDEFEDRTNETWWIPFTWTSSSNLSFATDNIIVISPQTKEYYINVNQDSWYIANLQQIGYYRVMYDLKNWQRLIQALSQTNHTLIHPLNKAQLLDDAFTFSNTDKLNYNITFDLFNYLQREDDFIPWISAVRGLNTIKNLMTASKQYELYKRFIRKLVARVYNSVGFDVQENDLYVTKRKRSVAFEIACEYDLADCLTNAQRILSNEVINTTQKVDPNLKSIGYCYGHKNGSRELWNYVLSKIEDPNLNPIDYISYLACSNDNNTIDAFLKMTLEDDNAIDVDMREYVLRYVALNGGPVGLERVLVFLDENFEELAEKLPFEAPMARIIHTVGGLVVTPQQIEAFDDFVELYYYDMTTLDIMAVNLSYYIISVKQQWINKYLEDIEYWLLANV